MAHEGHNGDGGEYCDPIPIQGQCGGAFVSDVDYFVRRRIALPKWLPTPGQSNCRSTAFGSPTSLASGTASGSRSYLLTPLGSADSWTAVVGLGESKDGYPRSTAPIEYQRPARCTLTGQSRPKN